jgi:hypothetical protein
MQWNPASHIPCVDIRTMGNKQLNNLGMPPISRRMQRGVFRPSLRIRIHTGIQVSFHSFDVSIKGGLVN